MSGQPPSPQRQPLTERTRWWLLLIILCWPNLYAFAHAAAGYQPGFPHTFLLAIRFLLLEILFWGVIFTIGFRLSGATAAQLRVKTNHPLRTIALGVVWFFAIRFTVGWLFWTASKWVALSSLWATEEDIAILTDSRNIAHHLPLSITVFSIAALTGGFAEELWRAGMLAGIKKLFPGMGSIISILLVAIVFAVAHLYQGVFGMMSAFTLGVLLGAVLVYRNSYWEAAIPHALFDGLSFGGVILAAMNVHGYDPGVVYAAAVGNCPEVRHWVAMGGDVNSTYNPSKDWKNITALECAAERPKHEDVVRYLLENGANPNLADSHGQTPLIAAAGRNEVENVQLLVAHGANLNTVDARGFTALRSAVEYNHPETARFLIESGADLNIRDNEGLSPLAAATKWGFADLKKLLQEKGGK